jgi:hypothetical protein
MEQTKNKVILEQGSHTHELTSKDDVTVKNITDSILKLKIKSGSSVITHGEHGTIATESEDVLKYVQQEYNPVSKSLRNAYD